MPGKVGRLSVRSHRKLAGYSPGILRTKSFEERIRYNRVLYPLHICRGKEIYQFSYHQLVSEGKVRVRTIKTPA